MNAAYEARDGYLYVKVTGEFNLIRARSLLSEWMKKTRTHSLHLTLCDVTLLTGVDNETMSILTRFTISDLVARMLPKDFRMAVLVTPQQFRDALFGQDLMINKGANVKLAYDLGRALKWLDVTSAGKSDELTDKARNRKTKNMPDHSDRDDG
jgi:hypothetical protein